MVGIEEVRRWIGLLVSARLRIPPVTALLNIVMILAYFKCTRFYRLLEPKSASLVWRALLSTFYHDRALHLFLDVAWTFITGTRFEKLLGSWRFLHTTALMIFISQGFSLLFNLPYMYLSENPHGGTLTPQFNNYALGFSRVLFALHFLLIASCCDHQQVAHNHHNNTYRTELLVECLVLIATFQALILPNSHLFNNLYGIVVGLVYVNTPPILECLVVCGMAIHNLYGRVASFVYVNTPPILKCLVVYGMTIYNKTLHLLFTTDWEAIYKSIINAIVHYYGYNDDHLRQEGALTNPDEYSIHKAEQELDADLQWLCKDCLSKNGIFLSFCEACTHPRA